jgi:hypothetical protein
MSDIRPSREYGESDGIIVCLFTIDYNRRNADELLTTLEKLQTAHDSLCKYKNNKICRQIVFMRAQTTRSLKTISFVVFLLTIFFLAFFDNSKNIPLLAVVNPFAEDPYDAVGSFGIQLALFAALLSLIRAFRPYATEEIPSHQQLLILRAETVALLSIIVTLSADIVALLRYPSMWINSSGGLILAGLVGGLVLLTTIVSLPLYRIVFKSSFSFANRLRIRAICFPVSILILAIYPADLLESIPGGIFTALVGMLILFICTWALTTAIFPQTEMEFEDVFDDFTSIYREVKSRVKFISHLEKFANVKLLHRLFSWLNPRNHRWNFIILIALGMGGSLMLMEALSEGTSTNTNVLILVLGVFLGLEGAGIILGYFLFGEFLGIFRKE